MIPYGHQTIDQDDVNAVVKVLKSDWLTQGPKVLEFERKLAKYCGAKYAVAVCNGTAALHLAYLAACLKKGDEVVTTPNTFVATTNMLLAVGAKPVFCDIRLDTYNVDENKIEQLITKKTKAIIPVHFAGQPCEMDKIYKIANKHKLLVIEDACHALGAKYKNKKIGSLRSDMTVFSFHPVKPITTGEGGAIVTNNAKFYQKLILLRNHGVYKNKQEKNVMVDLGYNYRLTDIQAALGISQLKKIDKFINLRRQVVKYYNKNLKNIKQIILPAEVKGSRSGWHIYVIRINSRLQAGLMAYLKKKGIGINFHYPAVYSHPYYQKILGGRYNLNYEEIYQSSCLTLPIYPKLKISEIDYICKKIKTYINEFSI